MFGPRTRIFLSAWAWSRRPWWWRRQAPCMPTPLSLILRPGAARGSALEERYARAAFHVKRGARAGCFRPHCQRQHGSTPARRTQASRCSNAPLIPATRRHQPWAARRRRPQRPMVGASCTPLRRPCRVAHIAGARVMNMLIACEGFELAARRSALRVARPLGCRVSRETWRTSTRRGIQPSATRCDAARSVRGARRPFTRAPQPGAPRPLRGGGRTHDCA